MFVLVSESEENESQTTGPAKVTQSSICFATRGNLSLALNTNAAIQRAISRLPWQIATRSTGGMTQIL